MAAFLVLGWVAVARLRVGRAVRRLVDGQRAAEQRLGLAEAREVLQHAPALAHEARRVGAHLAHSLGTAADPQSPRVVASPVVVVKCVACDIEAC